MARAVVDFLGSPRLQALVRDLQQPDVLWEFGTLAACLLVGWWLSRRVLERVLRARLEALDRGRGEGAAVALPGLPAGASADIPAGTSADMPVGTPGSAPVGTPRGAPLALAAATLRAGVDGLMRALWPLASLGLVLAARPVLAQYHGVGVLNVAVPLLGSFALLRALVYAAQRSFPNAPWLGPVLRWVAVAVWVGVALHLAGLAEPILESLDDIVVPLGKNKVSVLTIVQAALSVAVTLLLALWAGSAIDTRLMRAASLDSSLRAVLARLARALLLLVAVLVALSLVGLDLTVLSVFGGALGVGLGLGLQRIASNYVSGFIILLDRGLRLGDLITVDKYNGRVTQIRTRYTVVRSPDGTEAVVPNEVLVAQAVTNHSNADRKARLAISLPVAFDADVEAVLPLLVAAAGEVPRVMADPPPEALLTGFGPDGFAIELGFWIEDPTKGAPNVRSEVARAVLAALRQAGVELARPQRELRVHERSAPLALRGDGIEPPGATPEAAPAGALRGRPSEAPRAPAETPRAPAGAT